MPKPTRLAFAELCPVCTKISRHIPNGSECLRVQRREPRVCPTHRVPLVTFCPACRGGKGGQATSPAKQASARANAEKARAVKATRTPNTPP